MKVSASRLSDKQQQQLIDTLHQRFLKHPQRHPRIEWATVEKRIGQNPDKLHSLSEMEATGGEPDVVGLQAGTGAIIFYDCSPESPAGRRSLCYDRKALDARKENKPKNSVVDLAKAMGVELLTEQEYRQLQELGAFDTKTSSWVKTPDKIRNLGGALYCDRRYDTVFLGHNGADSYYAARGFRAALFV